MTLKKKDIRSMTKEDLRVFFNDMGEQPFRGNQSMNGCGAKQPILLRA